MIKYIDLTKSKQFDLPFFDEGQAKEKSSMDKGWSFSYVYHFIELKNVFIALKNIPYEGKNDFSKRAIESGLPSANTPWDSRRILEQLNALINFGLISKDYKIDKNVFVETKYSDEINESDLSVFYDIYHTYFRFVEIHSWLINPIQDNHSIFLKCINSTILEQNSKPIFPFYINSRFNNAFLFSLQDNSEIFKIPTEHGDLMRFWDVYVKWGLELKVLEKFNLKNLDYELSNNMKSFSCLYYINPEVQKFSLFDFIKSEYKGNNIHIPSLILRIALKYRYRIADIKKMVIEEAILHNDKFSLQRTSEIFIRNTEIDFVPRYRGSYISHLHLQ